MLGCPAMITTYLPQDQFCFAWLETPEAVPGANKAALLRGAKWASGDEITISFLDGDPEVHARVKDAALGWTRPGLANLHLSFLRDTNDTLVRISFQYPGSWSVIGTTCKQIMDLTRPTMNFGWLRPESTDEAVQRVVLHEFGHALGLIHEHQHPENGIQWNREKVYADLSGPPNNWKKEKIDFNMFHAFDASETNFGAFDDTSIMMYPFPPSWTINGYSAPLNSDLSERDRQFIRDQYP